MKNGDSYSALVTADNAALSELELSWRTAEFSPEDGIGAMNSLHEAGDALVAVARLDESGLTVFGSGVMVGPGLLLTATHVLDDFPNEGSGLLFVTFLPTGARAWLPHDVSTISKKSEFDETRTIASDISLVSCTLNSDAHSEFPLMLAPMQIALPLVGERLWSFGFRHQGGNDNAASVTPFVSSGLVTAAYPTGRGERMPSSCIEVNMDTVGGMSGGPVVNSDGYLVGIVSSSFAGGPSYITLVWDALRLRVEGAIPKLKAHETVSLLAAKSRGLVKIKGEIDRNPWGDITIKLSTEEGTFLADSIPVADQQAVERSWLDDDHRQAFVDEWGAEMEVRTSEAAVAALNRLPLQKARSFLEVSEMPPKCLDLIASFSVEDMEGVEDFTLMSASLHEDSKMRIEFFFDLLSLRCTVGFPDQALEGYMEDFSRKFIDVDISDGIAKVDLYQRCYFRGTMVFDQTQELFSDITIISSAIKRPRSS
jgi:hypothetical protein